MPSRPEWAGPGYDHPECMHATCDAESDRLVQIVGREWRTYCDEHIEGLNSLMLHRRHRPDETPGVPLTLVRQSELDDYLEDTE